MKRRLLTSSGIIVLLAVAIITLAGCAATYQTHTNKAPDYKDQIARLFVWSAIGSIAPFRTKSILLDDTYENMFHAALKRALAESGLTADVRAFSPKSDPIDQLNRFETEIAPTARLLIVPSRYQITKYGGIDNVMDLWLDLSLYDVRSGRRVWRSEIFIDSGQKGNALMWNSGGAERLTQEILAALKKDNLIARNP